MHNRIIIIYHFYYIIVLNQLIGFFSNACHIEHCDNNKCHPYNDKCTAKSNNSACKPVNESQKKYFLPQLIGSANTMKLAIEHLEPLLEKKDSGEDMPTLVIATVEGDIHDIGKNLVVLMLKNYGYNVIDMGKDVPCEDIVNKAIETNAAVIGLSALMTTTMMRMKDVVEICKEKGCKSKVVIGGACITQSFADEIGADGYSKDAAECVKLVERLLNS